MASRPERPLLLALALAAVRPVGAQVPPRRAAITGPAPRTAARAADVSDGVAVPEGVRSARVERDGEVIRAQPDGSSARRGTAARGARLPALEATQGPGCRGIWVRVATDAWICGDGVALTGDAPAATAQPVVPAGQVVPYQYAFATHAGVRTYRRLDDVPDDNWAEELERGMSVAVTGTARIEQGTFAHTSGGR